MRFENLAKHTPEPIGITKRFGILIPLVMIKGHWHVVYEERAHTLRSQPGEVCFPGGAVEVGESFSQAAVRETHEELGIPIEKILLKAATDFMVTPFNYALYPYVAVLEIESLQELIPNEEEVASVFTVPLDFLMTHEPEKHSLQTHFKIDEGFPFAKIQNGEAYNWKTGAYDVYFYEYKGRVIWGLTAKITESFITQVKAML
ncbi:MULTISPECIES: CoA pyrophosphatase [unclassified Fusibacter]|uniref:NUDIX hydrolase n=1 Tax=unclassified Fusibacter TaxID=2624464 RepID=UPI00101252AE|nr:MULTISPECIES: CoA pyrophosphatase [unclassified Fusibacter]MCK8058283.1 CoA pyrophosphatase [Fusibacter sp. A2]NPE20866.1 CoA pyrophosphatase [Fusibacter sp. A1]RXV63070.1 CoA pyrophosphatase [Fusibacter sp. A1]